MQVKRCVIDDVRDAARLSHLMQGRAIIRHLMQCEPDRDGRGTVSDATLGVNATEVRVSERWTPTRWVMKLHHDPDVNPCISIMPDGSRSVFTPKVVERDPRTRHLPADESSERIERQLAVIAANTTGRFTHDYTQG